MRYFVWLLLLLNFARAEDVPHVLDKKFWIASSFSAGATAADYLSSAAYIGPGHRCVEDRLMGFEPSNQKIALTGLADFALTEGAGYLLKRSKNRIVRDLWVVPLGYRSWIHIQATHDNYAFCR